MQEEQALMPEEEYPEEETDVSLAEEPQEAIEQTEEEIQLEQETE